MRVECVVAEVNYYLANIIGLCVYLEAVCIAVGALIISLTTHSGVSRGQQRGTEGIYTLGFDF